MRVFKTDWLAVQALIRQGRAEYISESQGVALVAATKGAGGPPDRSQPYSPVLASRRAWALRPAFLRAMRRVRARWLASGRRVATTLGDRALSALARYVGARIRDVESDAGRIHRWPSTEPTPSSKRLYRDGALTAASSVTPASTCELYRPTNPCGRMRRSRSRRSSYQELIREDWDQSELLSRLDHFLFVPIVGGKSLSVCRRLRHPVAIHLEAERGRIERHGKRVDDVPG